MATRRRPNRGGEPEDATPTPLEKPLRSGSQPSLVVAAIYLALTIARIAVEARPGPPLPVSELEFDGPDAQRVLKPSVQEVHVLPDRSMLRRIL